MASLGDRSPCVQSYVHMCVMSVRFWEIFARESTCSKEIILIQSYNELWFVKKFLQLYFQSRFSMSKIDGIFFKKGCHLRKSILETIFLKKNLPSIFEPFYFLKSCPIFDELALPVFLKIQWFPLSILIFGQKSCFLGPTIFRIPQPN